MILALAVAQSVVRASQRDSDFPAEQPAAAPTLSRKTPGLFRRPTRPSATEQFEYAEELEKAGRLRSASHEYYALVCQWHDSPEAPVAQMRYAELLKKRKRYSKAFDEFQYLIEFFPGRFPFEIAIDSQYRIANLIMNARHGAFLFWSGFSAPERALPLLEQILKNAPHWEKADQVQFTVGRLREQLGRYAEAAEAYEAVARRSRTGTLAEEAAFRMAECAYMGAAKAPRDEAACRSALAVCYAFVKDYPAGSFSDSARRQIAQLKSRLEQICYERALFYDRLAREKPEAALLAYEEFLRTCPTSDLAGRAMERIAVLKGMMAERK